MRHLAALLALMLFSTFGCSDGVLVDSVPEEASSQVLATSNSPVLLTSNSNACWGQATRVFAQMGVMGEHASEQPTPRLGLRNLARALYAQGVLEEDTMQALGRFVSRELGLEIAACM